MPHAGSMRGDGRTHTQMLATQSSLSLSLSRVPLRSAIKPAGVDASVAQEGQKRRQANAKAENGEKRTSLAATTQAYRRDWSSKSKAGAAAEDK